MHILDKLWCLTTWQRFNKISNKILLPKYLITDGFEVGLFVVVDGDKDNTTVFEKVAGEDQTRVHHIEPVGVIAGGGFFILGQAHPLQTVLISQVHFICQFFLTHLEFIRINKVLACIVRWVNINHINLAKIRLLQYLEDFKVVPCNKDILRLVKINTFLKIWSESLAGRFTCLRNRSVFADPGKLIGLSPLYNLSWKKLTKFFKVNGRTQPTIFITTFCQNLRKKLTNFCNVVW